MIKFSIHMKMKPLNDNVIIKPAIKEDVTKSGIILPDTEERPEKGQVVAVGEGKLLDNGQRVPLSVKVGDIIMFKKYSPDEIKVDDVKYLIVNQNDILAVME